MNLNLKIEILNIEKRQIEVDQLIGLVGRVFTNSLRDLHSIPVCIIPKTLKMVLDTSLLSTQQYKVRIKGNMEQSREKSRVLSYTSMWQPLKKEPSGHPRLWLPTLLTYFYKGLANIWRRKNSPTETIANYINKIIILLFDMSLKHEFNFRIYSS